MNKLIMCVQKMCDTLAEEKKAAIVLFGVRPNLASHLALSSLKHSFGYAPAADSTTCLASSTLTAKSFVKYPG